MTENAHTDSQSGHMLWEGVPGCAVLSNSGLEGHGVRGTLTVISIKDGFRPLLGD